MTETKSALQMTTPQTTPQNELTPSAELAREILNAPHNAAQIALQHVIEVLKAGGLSLSQPQAAALLDLIGEYRDPRYQVAYCLEGERERYRDRGEATTAHPAIRFELEFNTEWNGKSALRALLGTDAGVLLKEWGERVDFDTTIPPVCQAILFTQSNSKSRDRTFAHPGEVRTQDEDFQHAFSEAINDGHRFRFADDLQATFVCAAVLSKARSRGGLLDQPVEQSLISGRPPKGISREEWALLSRLRKGLVRTANGGLRIDEYSRLRATSNEGEGLDSRWAFGQVAP
ncbi:MAG: hypothetical protein KDD55_13245 [Bdellovibrionales bacterium]|nr:hypothetical protein [Bdellovibrionales bacterium]